jgi:hypothetical protein
MVGTAHIKINYLDSLVEGLVFCFCVALVIGASFLCVLGAAFGCRLLYSLWDNHVPILPFVSLGAASNS